jgi:tRNA(Ile)-lysidine synthase
MRTPFEQAVFKQLQAERILAPGSRVAAAVSGGADSVAMCRLLHRMRDELGIRLLVVHFNHSLRGAESDADEQFVSRLARDLDIECIAVKKDVAAECRRNKWNLEQGARNLRYAFFEAIVSGGKADQVAVAHTSEDQAETVLAHLIRGTGITGLGGIHPVAGPIVRPLLEICRQDLRAYLREIGQSWREDSSNADTRRLRARIREKLLPVLTTDFSPAVVSHLNTLARLSREEEVFWNELTDRQFADQVRANNGRLEISTEALLNPFPRPSRGTQSGGASKHHALSSFRALTERMVRRLYRDTRSHLRELTSQHVERVIHLAVQGESGSQVELPGGVIVHRTRDSLIFHSPVPEAIAVSRDETSGAASAYHYQVSVPERGMTTVSVAELGTCFRLKKIDWSGMASDTERESEVFDAELLHFPLILRSWRPGDAYRPKGRRNRHKLKELFLASRVPAEQRAIWPVIESGGQIVWARSMPPSADFLVSSSTRIGLVIEDTLFPVDSPK